MEPKIHQQTNWRCEVRLVDFLNEQHLGCKDSPRTHCCDSCWTKRQVIAILGQEQIDTSLCGGGLKSLLTEAHQLLNSSEVAWRIPHSVPWSECRDRWN